MPASVLSTVAVGWAFAALYRLGYRGYYTSTTWKIRPSSNGRRPTTGTKLIEE